MSPVDLIRNFVIDHYATEDAQRLAHARCWSPLEAGFGERTHLVDAGLRAFLRARGFEAEREWDLYGAFLGWWAAGAPAPDSATLADARLRELLAAPREQAPTRAAAMPAATPWVALAGRKAKGGQCIRCTVQ